MRASSPASNVLLAKARAMYGNSLKEQNFLDLLHCSSVSKIAAYLKNQTKYAAVLSEINEATIHRGHLELLLRRKLFEDFSSLSRYEDTVGQDMSRYLIERIEIEQIVHCLRLMSAGRAEEFFFSMPLYFSGQTHLDLLQMGRAKTQQELVSVLGHTPYAEILQRFPPEKERIRITEIENALYSRLANTVLDMIRQTSGELQRQLQDLYGTQLDTQNVSRILRLKTFFRAGPDVIRSNLLPFGGCISEADMEAMIQAASPNEVLQIFFSTRVGRRLPEEQRAFTHDLYHRVPYFNAKRHIHYSSHPMVVLASYMILMDMELDDIINIIEGVRYGMPPEEIKPMLVLVKQ